MVCKTTEAIAPIPTGSIEITKAGVNESGTLFATIQWFNTNVQRIIVVSVDGVNDGTFQAAAVNAIGASIAYVGNKKYDSSVAHSVCAEFAI